MTFDPELFKKRFDEACEVAEGVRAPTEIVARVRKQAGQEILVGMCPHCKTTAALDGEGRHLCRTCDRWLKYIRES